MDFTPLYNLSNSPMLRTQASSLLALHNFSTSAQELGNYPFLLNGVNSINGGTPAASLPDLASIKTERNMSPELSSSENYGQQRCPTKSSSPSEDTEGVWSPDIEIAFQEAINKYPPCGRRKIIFASEGKMYGRNELIARYIRDKTGKSRTRKQVSSHIQVLARKKSKEIQQHSKVSLSQDSEIRQQLLERFSTMSSAQIVNEDIQGRAVKRSRDSPPTSVYYPKVSDVKTESKVSPKLPTASAVTPISHIQPAAIAPSAARRPTLPFIKTGGSPTNKSAAASSAAAAVDFMMGGTTQASSGLNSYFPPSLQNIAFPRTLSSIVDTSFSVTRAARTHPAAASTTSSEQRLKLLRFNGYMEKTDLSWRHYFVDLHTETEFTDPNLERIDIEKIHDKFPSGGGSLGELFHAGPRQAFFLIKFWVNLNTPNVDSKFTDVFFGHDNRFESTERLDLKVSTKACSFGKSVVEKTQTVTPVITDGRMIYELTKSPLCAYMVTFIYKLKDLPVPKLMNNVLENFTILQHITDNETGETLLCIACMFEVSETNESQYSIYRLVGH